MCGGCYRNSKPHEGHCQVWLQNPLVLLTSFEIVPKPEMSIEEKINAITRLVIVVFVIMLVVKYKHSLAFLLISLALIILTYLTMRCQHRDRRTRSSSRAGNHPQDSASSWGSFPAEGGNTNSDPVYEGYPTYPGYPGYPDYPRFSAGGGNDLPEVGAQKSVQGGARDPRKSWPPTVPEDFVVRSGYGKVLSDDPEHESLVSKFQPQTRSQRPRSQFQAPVEQEQPEPTREEIKAQRAEIRKKSFTGGPRVNYKMSTRAARYHGYQTQDFEDVEVGAENDAAEEAFSDLSDEEIEMPVEVPAPRRQAVRAGVPVQSGRVKKTFLPRNYDETPDVPPPAKISNAERARPRPSGASRNVRAPVKWDDAREEPRKYDPDVLQFSKAAKAEKTVREQGVLDRKSQLNSLFST